tara:strand:- start:3377 stop:4474 length:1098 start_codon:yes stop_codon:yes gene_type:complete
MSDKQKINYASALAVHPLIAEHPLYKSMLESKMEKYSFENNNFSLPLSVVPTYYKQLIVPHCIVIEDYITLFFPHIHNGSNFNFNPQTFAHMPAYKEAFEDENFRGVVCHMHQTLESINKMFDYSEKIEKKLFYLPLAYESKIEKIKPTDPNKIVLTFTNSFGGQKNNFPLRGGLECLMVYKDLYESGNTNLFLNLVGPVNVDDELLEWFKNCENVSIHGPNTVIHGREMLTDDVIHNILLDTDIFLIPACRIHSMSVVRALCYGNVVIGSNGWGFNEFLDEEHCCDGQEKATYLEDGILKERYSINLEQPNLVLLASLKDKITNLIKNCSKIDKIKEHNLISSKDRFSKKKRDIMLEHIIENML